MGRLNAKNSAVNKQVSLERKIDDLEARIVSKIEIISGFSEPETKFRKLLQSFKFFDLNNSGYLDFNNFFAAMTNLNFIGVQREIEGLFNRYDDNGLGYIDYVELSKFLFGLGRYVALDTGSREFLEKIKNKVVDRQGPHGITILSRIILQKSAYNDDRLFIDRDALEYTLRDYASTASLDFQRFVESFDPLSTGKIDSTEFIRLFKSGISFERKQFVLETFRRLDVSGSGFVRVDDVLRYFDPSSHPSVVEGRLTPNQAADQLASYFDQRNEENGLAQWTEFLDYFKVISLAILDDNDFELLLRNFFNIPTSIAGSPVRRVLVKHSDGSQEVVELNEYVGDIDKYDRKTIFKKLAGLGIGDIVDVQI